MPNIKFKPYNLEIYFSTCIVRFITGGRSVMAHILSPWSKDLFHRAIVQSGAITDLRNLIPSHPPEYYARQVCPFIATFMATNLGVTCWVECLVYFFIVKVKTL